MAASNVPNDLKDGADRGRRMMEEYLDASLSMASSGKGSRDTSQPDVEEATFEHVVEEGHEAEQESILK